MYIRKIKNNINLNILNFIKIKPYKSIFKEKYMNYKQINHFKKILNKLYLIIKNKNIKKKKKILNNINKKKIINNIKYNIKKINKNIYGFCKKCNNKIGIKRLELNPITKLCINCKTIIEIKKKINNYKIYF